MLRRTAAEDQNPFLAEQHGMGLAIGQGIDVMVGTYLVGCGGNFAQEKSCAGWACMA